jgi:uncharacterized protein (DUF2384 family)
MQAIAIERLSAPALRTFENIADAWKLRGADRRALLGNVPASTYDRWRRNPGGAVLSHDALERISHIVGIYKALHVLFTSAPYADRWINDPNAAFAGATARERMTAGFTQLVDVRRYLDSARGW